MGEKESKGIELGRGGREEELSRGGRKAEGYVEEGEEHRIM